ncbi:MAG: ABC transporter substrate-binding protein [Candidatus Bipolaricaulota bacterium]
MKNNCFFTYLALVGFIVLLPLTTLLAAEPTRGGRLVVAIPSEPPGLDPTTNPASSIDRILYNNVYQGLVRIDEEGEIVPALARDWTITEEGTKYIFQLRRDVLFHDGTNFTADDVVYTFRRLLDPETGVNHPDYYSNIEGITSPDEFTVEIALDEANSFFLFNLARGDSVIFPRSIDQPATSPVGTGPFKLDEWRQDYSISLQRFEDYYEADLPFLDSVEFRFISDPSAMTSALRAGDVDVIGYGLPPETARKFEEESEFKVRAGLTTTDVILAMNNSRDPFKDIRVRNAVAFALNRQEIIEGATFGYGAPIGSHMSPLNPNYLDLTWVRSQDLERARNLLDAAGYSEGFSATLKVPADYQYAVRSAQIVADQLERVGIELTLRKIDMGRWLEEVYELADYDFSIIGHAEPFDIRIYTDPDYYFRYNGSQFRTVLDSAQKSSTAARSKWYGVAQWILATENPVAFLFELPSLPVTRSPVMGWWEDYPVIANDVTEVWLRGD